MAIDIPKEAVADLREIANMDEGVFAALTSALSQSKPTLSMGAFVMEIAPKLQQINAKNVAGILGTLFSLYRLKDVRELSAQNVSDDVVASASTKGLETPPEKSAVLKERLKKLLDFEGSLAVTAKALDVMTEHEHVFCGTRVLSDIRPVFTGSLEFPSAAVIIHNLEIAYHDKAENRHHEFYVALDENDIIALKKAISRAERQTVALKAMIENSKTTYLSP